MTALSPSPSTLPAPARATAPPDISLNADLAQLASRFESEHTPSTKTSKQGDFAIATDETNSRQTLPSSSVSKTFTTLGETAIFYFGQDFAHLDSAAITRVASMSPEESFKAELDLEKNGNDRYKRSDRPCNRDKDVPHRHRAFSAPQEPIDLPLVNRKLSMLAAPTVKCSGVPTDNGSVTVKPTAKEWVADIDCVSDIFGAMLADGDRIGPFM